MRTLKWLALVLLGTLLQAASPACGNTLLTYILGGGDYPSSIGGVHCPRENGYMPCNLFNYFSGDPYDGCPDLHDDQPKE